MNVVDLDNNYVPWSLTGHISKGRIQDKSSFHLSARKLLTNLFPTLQILEEVPIPLRRSETLYLDFYLPLIRKAVEVHGEQHYKFIPFYHHTKLNFLKSQKRDQEKKEWCEKNNISYVALPFSETSEVWSKLLHEQNS